MYHHLLTRWGGVIIYGVDECQIGQEVDSKDLGFEISNIDDEISRLENLLRHSVSPRMIYQIVVIPNDNKIIVVIRIEPSLNAPHRVTHEGHDKFYKRNSNGKYPMDVDELRTSFIKSSSLIDKVKGFVSTRIFDIQAGDTPLPILNNSCFLNLHILPLSAFTTEQRLSNEIIQSLNGGRYDAFQPFNSSGWNRRINLEGVVAYTNEGNGLVNSYTQMYRDGKVEALECITLGSTKARDNADLVPMGWLEKNVMDYTDKIIKLLFGLSFNPPFYVYLTLHGIKDFKVTLPRRSYGVNNVAIGINELRLPPVIIETEDFDKFIKFKPIFDIIWNASGISRSPNFDADGKYIAQ